MSKKNLLLEFIDINVLTELVDNFNALTGLRVGITTTDPDEHIIRVGWTDICKKYCQVSQKTKQQCEINLSSVCPSPSLGEMLFNKCSNGLILASTPIFIDGQLVAYLFSEQVLTSPPDISFFKDKAIQCGFDTEDYLNRVKKVKVIDAKNLKIFLTLLAKNISLLAEKNKHIYSTQDRLKQQSKVLKKAINLAPIGIGTAKDLKMTWCNQAMCRMTGYTEQELLDADLINLCKDKDILNLKEVENQYKIRGYSERLIKAVKKSGKEIDILISSAPIESQTLSGNIVFTIMDISEQLTNKALLEKSQQRLNIITQATKVCFSDWNLKTDQIVTNGPHHQKIQDTTTPHSYSLGEFIESIHPQDLPWIKEHIKQVKAGKKKTWTITYRVTTIDKGYRWISGTGTVVEKDTSEIPLRVIGVHQDVTETEQVTTQRDEENKKYREIVDHMSSAALTLTPAANNKFIIDNFNPAAESIYKTKREDAIGSNYIDRFPGSGADEIVSCMQRILKTGKPELLPLKHYSFEEFDIWGEFYIFLLPSKKIALIYNDYTEIKKAELELQKQHQELEETNITLKVLVRKYEEEKQKQEKIMATNVQMLVNPYLERIKNTTLTEKQQSYIDIVEAGLSDLSSPLATIAAARDFQLSQTETKIANLVRQGHPSKKIADIMSISVQTVHKHRATIRKKLGVANQNVNLISLLNKLD